MENTFDLEQFKQGVPAYTRDGRKATFVAICDECRPSYQLVVHIEGNPATTELLITGDYPDIIESSFDLVKMKSPYDHISKDDLVMVWDDDQTHVFAKLRKFAGYDNDSAFAYDMLHKEPMSWDNCLTVEEYVEKYL